MGHRCFCDRCGDEWECECVAMHEFVPEKYSVCICKTCHLPMNEGDHLNCPLQSVTCSEHLLQSTKEDAGGVPITFPPDVDEKAERAFQRFETYEAACLWCGHGYDKYSPKAEDEHFAFHCPDAPEELKDIARARLAGSAEPEGEQ
jgi:hypothetical protein